MAQLSAKRRIQGVVVALVALPSLTLLLEPLRQTLSLASDMLLYLLVVIVVALIGGIWPALTAALAAGLLLNFFSTQPVHTFTIASPNDALALVVFLMVAALVAILVERVEQRTKQAARAEEIAEIDRARSALLAAVSHDLRTPLASATAAVSSLRSTQVAWSEAESRGLLETAHQSLVRLAALIEDLLDMSRLEAGAVVVRLGPVALDELLPAVLDSLGATPQEVRVEVPESLPEIDADGALLQRVIANLLTNAMRYSPPGTVPLVSGELHGEFVRIRVVDQGPGISAADKDRVFQPFQRLGDRSAATGVGLGLAIARGLTEAMHGRLEADDTPTGGSTMVISLPVHEARR